MGQGNSIHQLLSSLIVQARLELLKSEKTSFARATSELARDICLAPGLNCGKITMFKMNRRLSVKIILIEKNFKFVE